jgi:hypothetical protein
MFEELKTPVGRPMEYNIPQQDMGGYIISSKFRKKVIAFFKFWDEVVKNKARGKDMYVANMENFFGEILDKFEEVPSTRHTELLNSEAPFKMLTELTNLRLPTVFPIPQDNKDFIEIFLTHKFE